MEVVRTELLTKKFRATIAVDSVSMIVQEGEIYGFLGLNGAGKSTTIRMLLGMVRPTAGYAFLFGARVGSAAIDWNAVGYMVEGPSAYPNLSVRENLEVVRLYRGLNSKGCIDDILDALKLRRYEHVASGELSIGNLQRLGLAKALLHRPKLLLLDEPANGLDPDGIVEVRNMLKDLAASGSTIFISSHILSEISVLATRIGVIHEGKLLKEHNAQGLHNLLERRLILNTSDNAQAKRLLDEKDVNSIIGVSGRIEISDQALVKRPEDLSLMLSMAALPPREIYIQEETLEEYFLRLVHST